VSPGALADITPRLVRAGCGSLGWWRVRQAGWEMLAAEELRQAYHLHTLQACVHEEQLQLVLGLLRARRVEPLLIKGWAVARLYPEPGLRPYADIDLCVRPEEERATAAALTGAADSGGWVDLHLGVPEELEDRTWEEVYRRSRQLWVGPERVRVLGAEDQLRLLCLHLVRHGAWRPLWLCDVGAALEGRPDDFDWDYFLSGSRRRSAWVLTVLALAGRLLGAEGVPASVAKRAGPLPRWLTGTMLREWGAGPGGDSHTRDGRPLADYLRRPAGVLRALRCRWPNPIEAAFKMRARPGTAVPRVCYQLGLVWRRAARFVVRLPGALGGPRGAAPLPFSLHRPGL
jgi:hypothetical protein